MTRLVLPLVADLINANDRLHFHAKAKLTRAWREAIPPEIGVLRRPLYQRARVVVTIRFGTNHRRDVGNYYPTAKAIVDGLVDAGVLPDDNDTHVIGPDLRREYPNGVPRVTVDVLAVEEAA